MNCRICESKNIQAIGTFKPYLDYECLVFDCNACGCRFVPYDKSIYEKLHSLSGSTYAPHEDQAKLIESYFIKKDINTIKKHLVKTTKNKFVIETIEKYDGIRKVLEVGCSKGYLTAYFILMGFDITGVDISATAVKNATERFGNHFILFADPEIERKSPYDVIYHVGTIGCVESPIKFTKYLLNLLKPNGVLIFNSPNLSSCIELGNIWIDGTPPPDLTTLFRNDFWIKQFGYVADVTVYEENRRPLDNLITHIQKLSGRNIISPKQKLFVEKPTKQIRLDERKLKNPKVALRIAIKYSIMSLSFIISCFKIIPKYKSQFGMYVTIQKRAKSND